MAVVATLTKAYDLDYIWLQVDRGLDVIVTPPPNDETAADQARSPTALGQ